MQLGQFEQLLTNHYANLSADVANLIAAMIALENKRIAIDDVLAHKWLAQDA